MGMFRDYQAIKQQSKVLAAGHDVKSDLSSMQTKLEALNASMSQSAAGLALTQGVPATATITAVAATGSMINFAPACQIDLLVMLPGRPPQPVSHLTAVPQMSVGRAQPGQVVSVRVMENDPTDLHIDWTA